MASIRGGTALHFIGRFQNRGSLIGLEPNLFKCGPQPREIIEIVGEHSTGKTLLITCLIKNVILPKFYEDKSINGLETEVILLNSDLHFSAEKLSELLHSHLKGHISEKKEHLSVLKEIVQSALKRLTIMNVYSSDSLYMTFHLLKKLLLVNSRISLIALDSISAFYWQDRILCGTTKMDKYIQNIILSLYQCISSFNVSFIFTRPSYFQSKFTTDCSPLYDLRNVNTSIHLKAKVEDSVLVYFAEIKTSNSLSVKFYNITDNGIVWYN